MFALMSSILGFSQLSEVKGVETKLVVYDGKIYDYNKTEWFGYSFYNMNRFRVSVEAELYMIRVIEHVADAFREEAILFDTKTFNLAPEETYIWKQEGNSDFKKYDREYPHGGSSHGQAIRYYVKYKAYKME